MRNPSRTKPLLSHAFKSADGFAPFGRLTLFSDRIERSALGRVRQTIPLADVQDVHWQTTNTSAPNFTLLLRDGSLVSGHLQGAGLWKVKLEALRRAPRPARLPADSPAAGRSAA